MNTNLTVTDRLSGREVTIIITLTAGEQPREERTALISLGVAGEMPVLKSGIMAEMPALLEIAWHEYSLIAQANSQEVATSSEAEVIATVPTDEAIPNEETPVVTPPPPPPQAKNLSIF